MHDFDKLLEVITHLASNVLQGVLMAGAIIIVIRIGLIYRTRALKAKRY